MGYAIASRRPVLFGPLPLPQIAIPEAQRPLQIYRQTRGVAAEPGEVLHLEMPASPVPGRGHKVWIGYARQGKVAPATLEVIDASAADAPVLQRSTLEFATDGHRWHDVVFAVPAGVSRVSLRISSPRPGSPPPPVVLSQPAVVPDAASTGRPNLVLISIDTLRADFLNTYGYEAHRTSPNIDRWAARGVVFENAIAPTPWTVPSHAAVFTGMDPDALGLDRLIYETPRLAEHATTLAELFRGAGYLSIAFTGGGTMGARNGFGDGFYLYQENHSDLAFPDLDNTIEVAQHWLRDHAGEPFFLFLHTFEIHAPYKYDQFASADLDGDDHQRAMYASGIAHVDQALARFVDFLDSQGLMNETLLVLTSDHGEGFADEHGMPEHGRSLYDEVLRVPLIMLGPGIPEGRVRHQVPLQDLFATLVDYFHLPMPSGVSSVSLLPTSLADDAPERTAYLCCMAHDFQRLGLRKDGLKYIRSEDPAVAEGPIEEVFDLERDPEESLNMAPKTTSALDSLRREALARAARNKRLVRGAEPLELDEEYREQLRALGYIE